MSDGGIVVARYRPCWEDEVGSSPSCEQDVWLVKSVVSLVPVGEGVGVGVHVQLGEEWKSLVFLVAVLVAFNVLQF